MNLIKNYWLLIFILTLTLDAIAQEEPYYKPIKNRNLEDLKYLPNLKTSLRSVYFGVSGGARFSGSSISPATTKFLKSNNPQLFWEAQIGYNIADKWHIEAAFAKNPLFLNTILGGFPNNTKGFTTNNGNNFNEFQLVSKRKIIQVDKVSQKVGIFLTSGISYNPKIANRVLDTDRYATPIFYGPNIAPDTVFHGINTLTSKHAFAIELGIELSGRITDQLGIGVFIKSWIRPKGNLSNQLAYKFNSLERQTFLQELKAVNLNSGVLLYYNISNWVKYKNKFLE